MMKDDMNSIAIFQADHPFQVHTKNVIRGLEASGYRVDLFLFRCVQSVDAPDKSSSVFDLSSMHPYWSDRETVLSRFFEALRYFIISPLKLSGSVLLPNEVFKESLKIAETRNYKCLIGVEKLGFVWASLISKTLGMPAIYYSLELYPTSNALKLLLKRSTFLKTLRFLRLRYLEKVHHKRAKATIVQDQWRALELAKMNGVRQMNSLLTPVSLTGPSIGERTNYLRARFNIPDSKRIILQLGIIEANRCVEEVVKASQTFPDNWVLVIHGPIFDKGFVAKVQTIDKLGRIIVSSSIIPPDDLDRLVCSADVGLCFYPNTHINDYLTGFSSEKLVRYLRCGIPVVTFDYPTFLDSVAKNGCGVCIRDVYALNDAISKIFDDYEGYRARAYNAFESHFEFNEQFKKIISYISKL